MNLHFGYAGAADEFAVLAVLLHQLRFALGTLFIQQLVRLEGSARSGLQAPRRLAIGIARAGQEHSPAAALDHHFAPAVVAGFDLDFAVGALGRQLGRKVADEIAIRIARTAQEKSVAADAFEQFALPALLALLPGGNARLVGLHLALGLFEVLREAAIEFLDRFLPGQLAFFDFVELFFHARREAHVENILETLDQQDAHFFAQHGGRKASLILGDVFALDDRGDDRSVGGRAPDAFFFQLLHQRRVVVARRRLGKMLLGAQRFEAQDFALGDRRQQSLARVRLGVFVVVRRTPGTRPGSRQTSAPSRWRGTCNRPPRCRSSSGRIPPAPSAKRRTAARSAGTA